MSLTKHEEGSVRELWSISLPLMLSSLSLMAMLFVDRLLLAYYSTSAFNAAVNTATFGWAFIVAWISLTGIAEVFVAQYNGAGQKKRLGEPVWQMIWLSVASIAFFAPFAVWGKELFYSADNVLEKSYFFWMMLFAPTFALDTALAAFFIGQGKISLVTWVALGANIVNVILDVALIFGIEGYIPEMGIEGAAIATSFGGIFQCLVMGYVFLNQQNRKEHGTNRFQLDLSLMWQCIKIGIPGSVFVAIEVFGFAAYYWMMTLIGESYITVAGICQSVVLLCYFVADGVSKAGTTIAGNLIGAGKPQIVPKVFVSGCILHMIFFFVTLVFYVFFSDIVIDMFLAGSSPEFSAIIRGPIYSGLLLILGYLFFEGVRMLLWGLLTAAGDTTYLLIAGSVSVWGMLVLPVYVFMVKNYAPIEAGMIICVVYSALASLVFYRRFQSGKWRELSIVN